MDLFKKPFFEYPWVLLARFCVEKYCKNNFVFLSLSVPVSSQMPFKGTKLYVYIVRYLKPSTDNKITTLIFFNDFTCYMAYVIPEVLFNGLNFVKV